MEENPPWRADLKPLKHLRIEKREDDHLFECTDVSLQAANGVKGDGLVYVHGVDVRQAGPDAHAVSDDPLSHVLIVEVHRHALHPGLGHAPVLTTPEPPLVRVRV